MNILHLAKKNWTSGVTVGLVSLPLSISLAVAANATPTMGVITAVWAGLIAAILGGSNYNITGPTGALSGLLATYAIIHGMENLPALAIVTGILIIISWVLHLEKYIIFIPSSVIHGFTLGVAFIIGLNQLNFATGLKNLTKHESFIQNLWESFTHIQQTDFATFGIFLIFLVILFLFLKYIPKIPGPIIVAPIGILLGYLSDIHAIPFQLQTLATKYGEIGSNIIQFPQLNFDFINPDLLKTAITVALIAILETLLSAKIADGMTKTKFNQRKELFGLGFANIASGTCGGIPATAALARTGLNVKTHATHRTSAGISSITVAIISVVFLSTFKYLPLSIVASILVYVAARMVNQNDFKHLYKFDKNAFWTSILVAIITIVEDPIIGILVGASIALLIFVRKLSKVQSHITLNKNKEITARITGEKLHEHPHDSDLIVYRFAGQLTYINAQSHLETLKKIHDVDTVILGFRNLFYIDLDGIDILEEIIEILEAQNNKVILTGLSDYVQNLLEKTHWYEKKVKQNQVFPGTAEALNELGHELK